MGMRRAAFFDLDGTLLSVNSAELWFRKQRQLGRMRRRDAALAAMYLAAYKLSVIDMHRAMGEVASMLRGIRESALQEEMEEFYREDVARFAAPGAEAVVRHHRNAGDMLVLLTSSTEYLAEPAREHFGLDAVLATRYDVVDGCFSGEVIHPICYGWGKVQRAEVFALIHGIDLSASAFYSDSLTDLPMLRRVGEPYAVNPDPRLYFAARRRGWPVLDWGGRPERKFGISRLMPWG